MDREEVWEVAREASIEDIVDALDLGPVDTRGKVYCWNHEENTPSVHVYRDTNRWYAYCCGAGGDTIRLVADIYGCSNWRAAQWIMSGQFDSVKLPTRTSPTYIDFTERVEEENSVTSADIAERIGGHWPALSPNAQLVAKAFGLLGSLQFLYVPHWQSIRVDADDHTVCYGVKTRAWTTSAWAKAAFKGSTFKHLYRPMVPATGSILYLTEGESDCWHMYAHIRPDLNEDIDVAALPSGAGNISKEIAEALKEYASVQYYPDADEAGDKSVEKLREMGVDLDKRETPAGRVAESFEQGWSIK